MLTMKVEVGRRGRGRDAFALVVFGKDPAVVTSAIAALVFIVSFVVFSQVNVMFLYILLNIVKNLKFLNFPFKN